MSPGIAHNSLSGKAPLPAWWTRTLQGGNRKNKSTHITIRICVRGTEIWAILQPLAQNNNLTPHSLMRLSCSPCSSLTPNLNTWTKPFQQVSAQILCTCLRPHSLWSNTLQRHPRPSSTWSVCAADVGLASTELPTLKIEDKKYESTRFVRVVI